jgi:hypothetical protein
LSEEGRKEGKHRSDVLAFGHEISGRLRNDISCEDGSKEHWDCRDESKGSPSKTWKNSVPIEIFPKHDPSHQPNIDGANHPKAVESHGVMVIDKINEGKTWQ